jgi:3-hydroxybutyrate dehydrogenase
MAGDAVRLKDRVAIVTGAAGGLGQAVCSTLRREGACVLGVDITGEGLLHADVGTAEGNQAMVEEALCRYGRIDVLVLNAGMQFMAPIAEFPEEEWDRLMNVMVKGPYLAMKRAWSALTARPGGRIIVTASTSSIAAEPYKAAYVAAKHGVIGLIKVAALEGAAAGLTANAVAPGGMLTPLIERQLDDHVRLRGISRQEVIDGFVQRHAVKRFVEPQEAAEVVAFLAGPESSGITGASIPVDLGLLAW